MYKKITTIVVLILMVAILILGFALKDSMNSYVSNMMKSQISPTAAQSEAVIVNSLYNFSENGESFDLTFIEFGAKGCSACRKMEKVMEEIKTNNPRVKVVFYNILKTKNQSMMKYFGISAIPTQVLLDKNGKEYFRHIGYISFPDLEKQYICKN